MNESDSDNIPLDWSDREPNISYDEESMTSEMMKEFEEARMEEEEEEVDDGRALVVETHGISRLVVNRYDPMCDHNEEVFSLGMRFESHEQFKNAVRRPEALARARVGLLLVINKRD
ncbi:hypothetical protein NL676_021013 [Syzygium grande]|nr:hypothetical protein NL676_021013 [Syzygium grande]